jgi:hypothetical protein
MNDYRIWFKVDGYKKFELPMNPQDLTISYPGNSSSYDVEGVGEIILPRLPKLATISIDSFFPRAGLYLPMANSDSWYPPEWYRDFFLELQRHGQTFEVTIARGKDIQPIYDNETQSVNSELVTEYGDVVFPTMILLDFNITDKGGEPGDIYYTMMLSEYRDASPRTLAEIAKETRDEDGNITSQELVPVVNRPPQSGAVVKGSKVEINGKVYVTEEQALSAWNKTKSTVNQLDTIVSRVLPYAQKVFPGLSKCQLHSVWVNGLGWVDKADCGLSETKGTIRTLNRIRTNGYV